VAADFAPGGILGQLSSKYIQEKATTILSLHYEDQRWMRWILIFSEGVLPRLWNFL